MITQATRLQEPQDLTRFRRLFTDDERDAALARLAAYGYTPSPEWGGRQRDLAQ
jgi:hypothetical protein